MSNSVKIDRSLVALASANLVGLIAVIVVNALANALPIAGRTTGELSDALPNLFVPAGITFYALVVVWALFGILLKRTAESAIPAQAVIVTSLVGIALLTSAVIVQVVRRKVY